MPFVSFTPTPVSTFSPRPLRLRRTTSPTTSKDDPTESVTQSVGRPMQPHGGDDAAGHDAHQRKKHTRHSRHKHAAHDGQDAGPQPLPNDRTQGGIAFVCPDAGEHMPDPEHDGRNHDRPYDTEPSCQHRKQHSPEGDFFQQNRSERNLDECLEGQLALPTRSRCCRL